MVTMRSQYGDVCVYALGMAGLTLFSFYLSLPFAGRHWIEVPFPLALAIPTLIAMFPAFVLILFSEHDLFRSLAAGVLFACLMNVAILAHLVRAPAALLFVVWAMALVSFLASYVSGSRYARHHLLSFFVLGGVSSLTESMIIVGMMLPVLIPFLSSLS